MSLLPLQSSNGERGSVDQGPEAQMDGWVGGWGIPTGGLWYQRDASL